MSNDSSAFSVQIGDFGSTAGSSMFFGDQTTTDVQDL